MRFIGQVALITGAFVLGACGGGSKNAASTSDTTAASAPAASESAAAPAAAPAAGGAAATSSAAAPITGKTWDVKMVGDAKGYRFEPASLTIKEGDGIKFTMVSGGPHDVAFDSTTIPAGATAQLTANMPNQMAPLQSNFLMNAGDSETISFAKVPKGTYPFHCVPHLALGMKGSVTVQ